MRFLLTYHDLAFAGAAGAGELSPPRDPMSPDHLIEPAVVAADAFGIAGIRELEFRVQVNADLSLEVARVAYSERTAHAYVAALCDAGNARAVGAMIDELGIDMIAAKVDSLLRNQGVPMMGFAVAALLPHEDRALYVLGDRAMERARARLSALEARVGYLAATGALSPWKNRGAMNIDVDETGAWRAS